MDLQFNGKAAVIERARRRLALMAKADFAALRKQVRHLVVKPESSLLMPALPILNKAQAAP